MKHCSSTTLALAAAILALPLSAFAQDPAVHNGPNPSVATSTMAAQPNAQAEAARMVKANAALLTPLDAKDMRDGTPFRAKLAMTAKLDNGTKLPSGTLLIGKVVNDDMQVQGMSKLALRITEAKLRDGKVIPIKATIVGVALPSAGQAVYPEMPGDQVPNGWSNGTLQVDQLGVLKGIDLHSRINSRNSGVFVSKTKDNVKLRRDTELELAIAPRSTSTAMAKNGV